MEYGVSLGVGVPIVSSIFVLFVQGWFPVLKVSDFLVVWGVYSFLVLDTVEFLGFTEGRFVVVIKGLLPRIDSTLPTLLSLSLISYLT